MDGTQFTVVMYVDDLLISCKKKEVVDEFVQWIETNYGEDGIGKVKVSRGNRHEYLAMTMIFNDDGSVTFEMTDYVEKMVAAFEKIEPLEGKAATPATERLFDTRESSSDNPKLDKSKSEDFHTLVAMALFLCQRSRPDILLAVAFLCTRVTCPDTDDWKKLKRMILYLKITKHLSLTLKASDDGIINWYADAAFSVHPDMKSHTGGSMSMGEGHAVSMSTKQKLNTKSSTEAEIVGADDVSSKMMWSKYFLEEQGYECETVLHQDNKSTILLLENGKASSSKRTRHINIRYFYLTDRIKAGDFKVVYCPTNDMIADFFSKPLQGSKFRQMRKIILNLRE